MMNEDISPPLTNVENLLGRRIVAGIIDALVLLVLSIVFTALFGDSSTNDGTFSTGIGGFPALIYFLLAFGYFFIQEATSGQTLGKKAMGIKVVSETGPMSWGKAAIRTILRIVDGFFFYLVGIVAIALSKKHQRIGDMAAGTVVVRA